MLPYVSSHTTEKEAPRGDQAHCGFLESVRGTRHQFKDVLGVGGRGDMVGSTGGWGAECRDLISGRGGCRGRCRRGEATTGWIRVPGSLRVLVRWTSPTLYPPSLGPGSGTRPSLPLPNKSENRVNPGRGWDSASRFPTCSRRDPSRKKGPDIAPVRPFGLRPPLPFSRPSSPPPPDTRRSPQAPSTKTTVNKPHKEGGLVDLTKVLLS